MNIIYAILTIIVILLACGGSVTLIYLAISWEPKRPVKQWTIHPDADKLLELDEHESKIS